MGRAGKPNVPTKSTSDLHYASEVNAIDTAIDEVIDDYVSQTDTSTQAVASLLHIGRRSSDPNTDGWGEDEKGYMWHNSTEGKYKYWNGAAIVSFPVTGGEGAPVDASYVTINAEAGLEAEVQHANITVEAQKHTAKVHPLGGDRHSADTLANLNTKVSDATLVDEGHPHTESDITDLDHDDTDAIHDNVSGEIAAITEKAVPVAADLVVIEDSEASNAKKKVQITNLPTGDDAHAIHDDESGEIAAVTEKIAPVSADLLLIEDSAAANVKKKVQLSNLPGGGTYKLAPSYTIYRVENYYYAMDEDGNIPYSNTSFPTVMNAVYAAMTGGGLVFIKIGTYVVNAKITVPNDGTTTMGENAGKTILNVQAGGEISITASNDIEFNSLTLDGTEGVTKNFIHNDDGTTRCLRFRYTKLFMARRSNVYLISLRDYENCSISFCSFTDYGVRTYWTDAAFIKLYGVYYAAGSTYIFGNEFTTRMTSGGGAGEVVAAILHVGGA